MIKGLAQGGDPIASDLITSERWQFAPDIDNMTGLSGSAQWYDITTVRQWAEHVMTYGRLWGPDGKGIFWDELEVGGGLGDDGDGAVASGE
jgi:hypothetical protein